MHSITDRRVTRAIYSGLRDARDRARELAEVRRRATAPRLAAYEPDTVVVDVDCIGGAR